MGQNRIQEDPRLDGRQAEDDAGWFGAIGGERAHVHPVRPWLSRPRGLRADRVHRANNAHYPGSYIGRSIVETQFHGQVVNSLHRF